MASGDSIQDPTDPGWITSGAPRVCAYGLVSTHNFVGAHVTTAQSAPNNGHHGGHGSSSKPTKRWVLPSRGKSSRKSFSTNIKPIVTETPVGRSEKLPTLFSDFFSRFFKYFFQKNFGESDFVGLGLLWPFVPRAL